MTATGFFPGAHAVLEPFPRCYSPFCSCVEDTAGFSLCSLINFTHQSHPRPLSPALSISYSVSISSECQFSPAYGKVSVFFFSSLSYLVSTSSHSSIFQLHWGSDSSVLFLFHSSIIFNLKGVLSKFPFLLWTLLCCVVSHEVFFPITAILFYCNLYFYLFLITLFISSLG